METVGDPCRSLDLEEFWCWKSFLLFWAFFSVSEQGRCSEQIWKDDDVSIGAVFFQCCHFIVPGQDLIMPVSHLNCAWRSQGGHRKCCKNPLKNGHWHQELMSPINPLKELAANWLQRHCSHNQKAACLEACLALKADKRERTRESERRNPAYSLPYPGEKPTTSVDGSEVRLLSHLKTYQ